MGPLGTDPQPGCPHRPGLATTPWPLGRGSDAERGPESRTERERGPSLLQCECPGVTPRGRRGSVPSVSLPLAPLIQPPCSRASISVPRPGLGSEQMARGPQTQERRPAAWGAPQQAADGPAGLGTGQQPRAVPEPAPQLTSRAGLHFRMAVFLSGSCKAHTPQGRDPGSPELWPPGGSQPPPTQLSPALSFGGDDRAMCERR